MNKEVMILELGFTIKSLLRLRIVAMASGYGGACKLMHGGGPVMVSSWLRYGGHQLPLSSLMNV